MPQIVEYIDAIARQKKRDVLFVEFVDTDENSEFGAASAREWRTFPMRKEVITWLDWRQIDWQMCGPFANEHMIEMSYRGQIYIDIPFDPSLPQYVQLAQFLENPDGTMKLPGVRFCYTTYEAAMKNAHHDEPGYWDSLWKDDEGEGSK